MKQQIIAAIAAATMLISAFGGLSAGAFDEWSYAEDVSVYVNGTKIDNGEYKPIIANDRTMVRVVPIFEALNYWVQYNEETKSLYFGSRNANASYRFTAESPEALIIGTGEGNDEITNSTPYKLDVPATLKYFDTFYVPARAFCEMVGLINISWDNATRSVYITDKQGSNVSQEKKLPADEETNNVSVTDGLYYAYVKDDSNTVIAVLDITKVDNEKIMINNYSRRHGHQYNIGNVYAYLQSNGTYAAEGENRRYILTIVDGKNINFEVIEGTSTVDRFDFVKK